MESLAALNTTLPLSISVPVFGEEPHRTRQKLLGFFFKFIYLFIYLFLAALGLCCCIWAFSSFGEWGLLFVAVRGLLIALASLVAEHGL